MDDIEKMISASVDSYKEQGINLSDDTADLVSSYLIKLWKQHMKDKYPGAMTTRILQEIEKAPSFGVNDMKGATHLIKSLHILGNKDEEESSGNIKVLEEDTK